MYVLLLFPLCCITFVIVLYCQSFLMPPLTISCFKALGLKSMLPFYELIPESHNCFTHQKLSHQHTATYLTLAKSSKLSHQHTATYLALVSIIQSFQSSAYSNLLNTCFNHHSIISIISIQQLMPLSYTMNLCNSFSKQYSSIILPTFSDLHYAFYEHH